MENNFTRISSYERNGNTVHPVFPTQFPIGLEKDINDWDLRQLLGLLQRRFLIIVGVSTVVMSAVAYSTLQQKPLYESNFQLLVESVNEEKSLAQLTLDPTNSDKAGNLDYESQIQVLKSPELMADIVKQINAVYPDISYGDLINNLTIRRLGTAKIIDVRYRSSDSSQIKVVLDIIAKAYLNYSLEKRQTKLRQGVEFVDKQLPTIKNRVDNLQKELQLFRQKYEFISPDTQAEQVATRVGTLSDQRLEIAQKLAEYRAAFASLKGQEGELAALNNAPLYQEIYGQLTQLETQIAGELVRFQEDSPPLQTLRKKKDNLVPLLKQEAQRIISVKFAEIATQIQILEAKSQELSQAEITLDREVKLLPVLSRRYTELQRDLQIATESLNRFLITRETLQIQVAQTELPWELIQEAFEPEKPISPNVPRSLTLGFVASLLVGLGISLLIEKVDNTFHSVDNLKEHLKLPILGVLPFEKKIQNNLYQNIERRDITEKSTLKFWQKISRKTKNLQRGSGSDRYYGQGRFWECIQVLYSNIQLLSSDQTIKSLVISSALPGDGKSTVSFQLAQIAAAMGKRVLLVDADLRRPQVHRLCDLNNLWGLSSLISTNIPAGQVIRQMPDMNNLSVVTSGPIPPDPARLLSSEKMKQLMGYFQRTFDLVIYDVPPIVGLVDARMLAPYTDGVVLVVRIDKTDKTGILQAQESLRLSPINLLGVVANADKTTYKGYKHYYKTY
ncbi:polysaccharide biosynthesis tyrosine autokinase [Calothrix sp. FACHB-1219]|uniref:GumC family protein n=1 Tax=unclassified Calothrix TaxID=2619626 RepID=UPI0016848E2F|nr:MULTISPECIES: polysaccharide biosynthesis tyrosine autokinase [unclassified Calothrix]MBD2201196.1 polysaccharide biosynthesis tyrosine autokinase [Calothrix sp. FACHB-168]MBD2215630.1 polysaccharide biosynthesis tyrosine autokinase [Calothrix sp. FACHB-1219]